MAFKRSAVRTRLSPPRNQTSVRVSGFSFSSGSAREPLISCNAIRQRNAAEGRQALSGSIPLISTGSRQPKEKASFIFHNNTEKKTQTRFDFELFCISPFYPVCSPEFYQTSHLEKSEVQRYH